MTWSHADRWAWAVNTLAACAQAAAFIATGHPLHLAFAVMGLLGAWAMWWANR